MRNAIDSSTNPCNDFYQFACGNFIKTAFLVDAPQIDTFTNLAHDVQTQLKTIFDNEIDSNESRVFALIRQLYESCMNVAVIEAVGLKRFTEIARQLGGWPTIEADRWNETAFDWIESIRQMRHIGLPTNHFFDTQILAYSSRQWLMVISVKRDET